MSTAAALVLALAFTVTPAPVPPGSLPSLAEPASGSHVGQATLDARPAGREGDRQPSRAMVAAAEAPDPQLLQCKIFPKLCRS